MRVNDMMNKKNCWLRLLVSSGVVMLQVGKVGKVGKVHLCDMRTRVAVHCKVSHHSSALHSTK